MLMMLGVIISMLSAVLFYRTAAQKGAPAIQWAVVGFLSYFLTNLGWSLAVSKPIALKYAAQNLNGKAAMMSGSGILIGALSAWLIWTFLLSRLKPNEADQ